MTVVVVIVVVVLVVVAVNVVVDLRNLPFKIWSNSWDIADIEFVWVVVVA